MATSRGKEDFWFAKVDRAVMLDKTLSQTAKYIFAVLCTFADSDKRGCWPSNDTVAEAAGVSERTLIRAYKELEARGVIARETRFNDGQQTSSYTLIVGHNALCYGGDTSGRLGVSSMTDRTRINERDIKDSLTREAELPDLSDMPLVFENGEAVIPDEPVKPDNPEEVCTPEDAPDIMKSTAELFLHKTGRKGLTWPEISALRTLAASQYPSRVQKEIDTACRRFLRKNAPLHTLTFMYIASSLQYQPSRSATGKPLRKAKPKPEHAELAPTTETFTDEELAEVEAEIRREGA